LWYLQNAEGVRRDIRIVNLSLVNIDWYVLQMKYSEPFGAKKVPITISDDDIKELGTVYFAALPPQPVSLPAVPRSKWEEYGITDTNQIRDLTFTIPTISQIRGQKVMRMQDAVIYNILQNSKWERPVYFALTSGSDRIGTDPFLELQGMSLEVTPIKKKSSGGYALNNKVLEEQLLSENVQPSKDFQRGFIFHNYNNPNINMEEQAQEMVDGIYRALYVMAARQFTATDKEKSKKYLETMERRMPYSILPIRYDLLLDIFDIVTYFNDEEKIKYYSPFAEKETLKKLARNPRDVESMSILTMIYERMGQYEKALGIYNKYLEINPNDPSVKERIATIQAIMKGDTTKKLGDK
jgi:hypothetical protein